MKEEFLKIKVFYPKEYEGIKQEVEIILERAIHEIQHHCTKTGFSRQADHL